MLRHVQNEMFTFEIDSENALVGCTLPVEPSLNLKTSRPSLQRSNLNFRRLTINKWLRFAVGALAFLKKFPLAIRAHPSREMHLGMPRAARQPTRQLRKLSKSSITRFTRFTEFFTVTPLGSDNSHFFNLK
jgi:hypothetical protein